MSQGDSRPLIRPGISLMAELNEQLDVIGIDPALIGQAWDTDGLVNDTRRRGIQTFTDDPVARLAVKQVAEENVFKFGLYPDYGGVAENVGSHKLLTSPNGSKDSEQIQVAVSPTALLRVVEPVASVSRALEFIKQERSEQVNNLKVLQIGLRAAFVLGLARSLFEEAGNRHDNAEYVSRLIEIQTIKPTQTESIGPLMVDEIGLMFGGAVCMRYCRDQLVAAFRPNVSPSSTANLKLQVQLMLQAMANSRHTTGDRSARRRVSFALENAYMQEQMRQVIDTWFVARPDPDDAGGTPAAPTLKSA